MGVQGTLFQSGGKASTHRLPGSYSRISFVKGAGGLVSVNNAVIMGDCRGGKPNDILWFGSAAEAEETLIRGTLLDAIKHAFKPGDDYVPDQVGALRVNPGTQATSIYLEGANTMFTAAAWDYGLHTNQIRRKIESGTTVGKKITVQYKSEDEYVVDNILRTSFSIQYTGAGSAAAMTITLTSLATTVTAGPGGEDLTVLFSAFTTIDDLVAYINDQSAYTATVTTGDATELTTQLDTGAAIDIMTGVVTQYSNLQAVIEAVDACPWVDNATYNAIATTRVVPDNAAWEYFTGAIDGAYTATEWGVSLTAMATEDVQFIGTSSNDAAVHALVRTHLVSMNAVKGKRERQAILGGALGETEAQVVARALSLNSNAVALCYPGFKDYNENNVIVDYSPVYYAAKEIGRIVSMAINEPSTKKGVQVLEWERDITDTEAERLIAGGVWAGIKDADGIFINARSINTYQGTDLQQAEFSMMRIALFVSRDLRTTIEKAVIGRPLTNGRLTEVDGMWKKKMKQYTKLGLFNGNPPYWGYQRLVNGDTVILDYHANITPPFNFSFITSYFHVYVSTT